MLKNSTFPKLLQTFFHSPSANGIVLFSCALLAMSWANSPLREVYFTLWHAQVGGLSLHHWINDGLMAVFFFSVGLEMKREMIQGDLSTRAKAILPLVAALGGMLIPMFIYFLFNGGTYSVNGWGIPMATDIAFALGLLTLLGNRVPTSLKVFLTTLAVVDDLGAVLVIALFYAGHINWISLAAGVGMLGILIGFNRCGVKKLTPYIALGAFAWFAFLKSGVHPTIAGVLLAFIVPAKSGARIEHPLSRWVSFGIMPLFAFANAGVFISSGDTLVQPLSAGILLGLVIGKQVGITLFCWLAVRFKIAVLPRGVAWKQIYGISCLGGIGFTMSLFISNLAFSDVDLIDVAKLAVLCASVISGALGAVVLIGERDSPKTTKCA